MDSKFFFNKISINLLPKVYLFWIKKFNLLKTAIYKKKKLFFLYYYFFDIHNNNNMMKKVFIWSSRKRFFFWSGFPVFLNFHFLQNWIFNHLSVLGNGLFKWNYNYFSYFSQDILRFAAKKYNRKRISSFFLFNTEQISIKGIKLRKKTVFDDDTKQLNNFFFPTKKNFSIFKRLAHANYKWKVDYCNWIEGLKKKYFRADLFVKKKFWFLLSGGVTEKKFSSYNKIKKKYVWKRWIRQWFWKYFWLGLWQKNKLEKNWFLRCLKLCVLKLNTFPWILKILNKKIYLHQSKKNIVQWYLKFILGGKKKSFQKRKKFLKIFSYYWVYDNAIRKRYWFKRSRILLPMFFFYQKSLIFINSIFRSYFLILKENFPFFSFFYKIIKSLIKANMKWQPLFFFNFKTMVLSRILLIHKYNSLKFYE